MMEGAVLQLNGNRKPSQSTIFSKTKRFAEKLSDRSGQMQTYFDDQLEASEDYEPLLVELHRQVHALAGTSGTFGYEKVSLCLRELEAHLDELIESVPISFDAKCVNKIKSYFSSIDAAISDISL